MSPVLLIGTASLPGIVASCTCKRTPRYDDENRNFLFAHALRLPVLTSEKPSPPKNEGNPVLCESQGPEILETLEDALGLVSLLESYPSALQLLTSVRISVEKLTPFVLGYGQEWAGLVPHLCHVTVQSSASWGNRGQNREVPKLTPKCLICLGYMGRKRSAPGVTRTPDLLIRSQTLYPTELRARRTEKRIYYSL